MNITESWLEARKQITTMYFARSIGTTTVLLYGPGQIDSSGVPVPCNGTMKRLAIYDGTHTYIVNEDVPVDAGDLISIQAAYYTGSFTIIVQKNSGSTPLSKSGIGTNRTVWVSLLIEMVKP